MPISGFTRQVREGIDITLLLSAAINEDQILQVGSDAFNAVALAKVPMSYGLWAMTQPVDVKLVQGLQSVRVAVIPGQRGVAVHSFEMKQKEHNNNQPKQSTWKPLDLHATSSHY